jgi:hypothetical protein
MTKIFSGTASPAERIRSREHIFPWLLLATLLPIVVMPFSNMSGNPLQRLVLAVATLNLVIQCLRTMPRPVPTLRLTGSNRFYQALGIYTAVTMWIPSIVGHHSPGWLHLVILGSICGFYLLTAIRIVQILVQVEGVNSRTLCLGAAGYVHVGLTAGQLATFLEVMHPGSFNLGLMLPGEEIVERLNYYTFITMGSIGYGDILPATPPAEFFAVAVSITGTLYVSLMIGLLLSRYINDEAEAMKQQLEQDRKKD